MVQREVKNKTGKYAIAAVLSAVMLVSVIYVFGAVPTVFPPSQSPTVGGMKTFSSNQQIIDYLTANQQGYGASRGPLDSKFFGSRPAPVPAQVTSGIEGFLGLGETVAILPSKVMLRIIQVPTFKLPALTKPTP